MLKLAGFLTGSALVSAALWFVIGGPLPLSASASLPGAPRLSEHVLSLPRPEPAVPPVVDEAGVMGAAATLEPPPVPDPSPAPVHMPVADSPQVLNVPEEVIVEAPEPSLEAGQRPDDASEEPPPGDIPPAAPAPDAALVDGAVDAASERAWHPVWQPFHSEVSARGFANRLERLTGLDYRVDRVAFDSFQVSVAYRDDADLDASVARISSATGLTLSLPGALP